MDGHSSDQEDSHRDAKVIVDPPATDLNSPPQENARTAPSPERKGDLEKHQAFLQQLFVEQYKATRAEILISVQTSQRMLQYIMTAVIALSGFMASYISGLNDPLLISGYVISFVYGFILCITLGVTAIGYFMEMLRLSRVVIFLKYLEDKSKELLLDLRNRDGGEDWHFSKFFDGYSIFWETWARGKIKGEQDFISNWPYRAVGFFILITALFSALFSLYVFSLTYFHDEYNVVASKVPAAASLTVPQDICRKGFFCNYHIESDIQMTWTDLCRIVLTIMGLEEIRTSGRLEILIFACRAVAIAVGAIYSIVTAFVLHWVFEIQRATKRIRTFNIDVAES